MKQAQILSLIGLTTLAIGCSKAAPSNTTQNPVAPVNQSGGAYQSLVYISSSSGNPPSSFTYTFQSGDVAYRSASSTSTTGCFKASLPSGTQATWMAALNQNGAAAASLCPALTTANLNNPLYEDCFLVGGENDLVAVNSAEDGWVINNTGGQWASLLSTVQTQIQSLPWSQISSNPSDCPQANIQNEN